MQGYGTMAGEAAEQLRQQLAQPVGRPGHPPAVVAVGGGEEGGLAELLPQLFAGEVAVGHLGF